MTELEEMDELIKASKESIAKAEALGRLKKNKDFKKTIIDLYLLEHAAHLVQSKASPHLQSPADQSYIDGQIIGIGHLVQFMNIILTQGVTAKSMLESHEDERLSLIGLEEDN